jgi:arylsulfatase A-like enzyme
MNRYLIPSIALPLMSLNLANAQEPKHPNLVLILADDMGFSDLGCYGSEIRTPNMDRLAQKGIRFTQFYNGARCCPTRAALLTGLYAHQTGLGDMVGHPTDAPGYQGEISNQCVTIAEALHAGGYSTYMAGKWHVARSRDGSDKLNWPRQRGFDRFFGTIDGAGNYFNPYRLVMDNDFIKPGPGFYYTYQIAEHATQFIRVHEEQNPGKPFFLYSAFTAPHWPLQAPDSLIRKQKGNYDRGWDELRKQRLKKMVSSGLLPDGQELSARNGESPPWDQEPQKEWMARRMEVYAAQIEALDYSVGMIINTLDELNLSGNTYVIFLSDNGGCAEELEESWRKFLVNLVGSERDSQNNPMLFCNHPEVMPGPENTFQSVGLSWANMQNTPFRLFKSYDHEGGISTPLILCGPKVIPFAGEFRRQTGMIIDIMATCLDLANISYPLNYQGNEIIPLEGKSLVPLLDPDAPAQHEFLFWEHEGSRAVRMANWKLVAKGGKGAWEIYDLVSDRIESVNLASAKPDLVDSLANAWNGWAIRTHVLPKPSKN